MVAMISARGGKNGGAGGDSGVTSRGGSENFGGDDGDSGASGFTRTKTVAKASDTPALPQVISKIYVPSVMPVRSSKPPAGDLSPLQLLEAVQLSGSPVVVQVSRALLSGRVRDVGYAVIATVTGTGGGAVISTVE